MVEAAEDVAAAFHFLLGGSDAVGAGSTTIGDGWCHGLPALGDRIGICYRLKIRLGNAPS